MRNNVCICQGNTENRSVVNVSSTSGLHGNVGQANYSAAKSAVVGLTKTLCKEWGPFGVRANVVAFGRITTRYVCMFQLMSGSTSLIIMWCCPRLTAAKENGETIEIDGKKVALGIPTAKQAGEPTSGPAAFPGIPLARAGSPDEAAAAVLL